jgi:restriction system protein
MSSWKKEEEFQNGCVFTFYTIGFFVFWINTIIDNLKFGLILFPGLFILGYILIKPLPKSIRYIKKFLKKCDHKVFGGLTLKRCDDCNRNLIIQERLAEIVKLEKLDEQKRIEFERNRVTKININWKNIRKTEKTRIEELNNLVFENIINVDAFKFEYLIARLFQEMGYKVRITPKSNDGGKDLILRKGDDLIFVECKRHKESNKIGRPVIQKFHSAIITGKAKKGIVVTTSYFTDTVFEYSSVRDGSIELIDRNKLKELLLQYFGDSPTVSFSDICLVCGIEFEHGFSKIDYCRNGHKAEYITLEHFLSKEI